MILLVSFVIAAATGKKFQIVIILHFALSVALHQSTVAKYSRHVRKHP
jgi:hypothetical protein